jgi:hypothetical protein
MAIIMMNPPSANIPHNASLVLGGKRTDITNEIGKKIIKPSVTTSIVVERRRERSIREILCC